MTLEEFCAFFDDKHEHYPVSDIFMKAGYMQKEHGYIRNAKISKVEPNQKWHLLKSYYTETKLLLMIMRILPLAKIKG